MLIGHVKALIIQNLAHIGKWKRSRENSKRGGKMLQIFSFAYQFLFFVFITNERFDEKNAQCL